MGWTLIPIETRTKTLTSIVTFSLSVSVNEHHAIFANHNFAAVMAKFMLHKELQSIDSFTLEVLC